MNSNEEVTIIRGNVKLKTLTQLVYEWTGKINEDRELVFKNAYKIEMTDRDEGIVDCIYTVNGRVFKDLSFMTGRTIQKFSDDYAIREYEDGTKFLSTYGKIPTFDYYDRLWASRSQIAIYCDEFGINLIQCYSGYKLASISIYLKLVKSIPSFTEWIRKLGYTNRFNDST